MNYAKNLTGNMCVGTSLINYFITIQDEDTARKVADEYRFSPLVMNGGGIHPGLTTRLVRDLTDGEYAGILHVNWGIDPIETIKRIYKEDFTTPDISRLVDIVQEETEKNNIRGYTAGFLRVQIPTILFLDNSYGDAHAVVYLSNGNYINDGEIVGRHQLEEKMLEPMAIAMLEIVRQY